MKRPSFHTDSHVLGRQCALAALVLAALVGGCEPKGGADGADAKEGVYGLIEILRPPGVGVFARQTKVEPAELEMVQRTQMALIKTRSLLQDVLKQQSIAALELIIVRRILSPGSKKTCE